MFDRNFLKTVIGRMDENDALFRRILDDPEFQEVIKDFYGAKVYREARKVRGNPKWVDHPRYTLPNNRQ